MVALANSKVQYVGSTEWSNIIAWIPMHSYGAGVIITNAANTPALGNERAYVSVVAGTAGGSPQTALGVTFGSITVDGTVSWQECTGRPGVNGDITNSSIWAASSSVTLGQMIYDSTSGSLQIDTIAGTTGASIPTFSATAGHTTGDNTAGWTSLGLASAYSAFGAPHKRILNADAAAWQTVVPAQIFISSDHSEQQGSALTLAGGQGTTSFPNQYLSVSNAVAPPTTVTVGATAATSGANNLSIQGYGYYYGITFNAGSGASSGSVEWGGAGNGNLTLENCTANVNNTAGGATIGLGSAAAQAFKMTLLKPTFIFGATLQQLQQFVGEINIINATVAQSGSVPSVLVKQNASAGNILVIRDSDLSAIVGTLLNPNSLSGNPITLFENCKLGSGVAMTTGAFLDGASILKVHNCDSGSKNYRFFETNYLGTIQQETTIVDNTNPASNGNQTISWNIAPGTNNAFGQPYISPEIAQWCSFVTNAHSATLQINNTNGTLNNGQVWMELECLDTSGFPIGSSITSRVANPITATSAYSASTDSWGGSLTHPQFMKVAFTPLMAGYIKARVYVAAQTSALSNLYISPILLVT